MKIAICTPIHGPPRTWFMNSLASLLIFTGRRAPELELRYFLLEGSNIIGGRNELARLALEWDAAWTLWLDADHTFPPDALVRLLSHGKSVVGCNYVKRDTSGSTTAEISVDGEPRPVITTSELAEAKRVEEVSSLGFGVIVVRADVLRKHTQPIFDQFPEDRAACAKFREGGDPVFLDHALSWQVGHVGEYIYSNARAAIKARGESLS